MQAFHMNLSDRSAVPVDINDLHAHQLPECKSGKRSRRPLTIGLGLLGRVDLRKADPNEALVRSGKFEGVAVNDSGYTPT